MVARPRLEFFSHFPAFPASERAFQASSPGVQRGTEHKFRSFFLAAFTWSGIAGVFLDWAFSLAALGRRILLF